MEAGIKEVYGNLPETLPDYLLKEYNLEDINNATKHIHFPDEFKDFNIARNRLVFEELLSVQLALLELKNSYNNDIKGIEFSKEAKMSDVINTLPFKLTKAQLRVIEEIDSDMESNKNMNRLLQGDVGSGKTVVAMCAAYKAVKSGYQAAIMAPTAILATQHLENFKGILENLGIRCELLIILNNKNEIIKIKKIAQGGINSVNMSMREILVEPIKMQAPKMILIHNHPSGDSTPSKADIQITQRLLGLAQLFDIELLDHIVIGNGNFTSIISKILTKDGEI